MIVPTSNCTKNGLVGSDNRVERAIVARNSRCCISISIHRKRSALNWSRRQLCVDVDGIHGITGDSKLKRRTVNRRDTAHGLRNALLLTDGNQRAEGGCGARAGGCARGNAVDVAGDNGAGVDWEVVKNGVTVNLAV